MVNEPLRPLEPTPDARAVAAWVIEALGAVLRIAKIPTVRDRVIGPEKPNAPSEPGAPDTRTCHVVLPTHNRVATDTVLAWILGRINGLADLAAIEQDFKSLQQALAPHRLRGANHWRTVQAAFDERHPVPVISPQMASIGLGVQRRWFSSFVTERTPYLGMQIAQSKQATATLLRSHGLPGAAHRLVHHLDEALAAAAELGYPLVVKPNDQDRGEGVAADLMSEPDLIAAYRAAAKWSAKVLVEKFQPGFTHRITVIEGQVIRVARHEAFGVRGNGQASIEQLVAERAQTPEERKRPLELRRESCVIDDEALGLLRQQGLTPAHVPAAGQYVKLRRRDNISAGGQRITLSLDDVHPDNLNLALDVTRLVGLDFAGIDFITPDIGQSWRALPGTICEVNGNPQLVARDDPMMYRKVLRQVLAGRPPMRVAVVLLPAPPDAPALERLVSRHSAGKAGAGLAMAAGTWIAGRQIGGPFDHGPAAAQALSTDPAVREFTFVLTLAEVARFGLITGSVDAVILPWARPADVPPAHARALREAIALCKPHAQKIVFSPSHS